MVVIALLLSKPHYFFEKNVYVWGERDHKKSQIINSIFDILIEISIHPPHDYGVVIPKKLSTRHIH